MERVRPKKLIFALCVMCFVLVGTIAATPARAFFDDFEDESPNDPPSGWFEIYGDMYVSDDNQSWGSQYLTTNATRAEWGVSNLDLTDFILDVDVVKMGGGGFHDIMVRFEDRNNYLCVRVESDEMCMYRVQSGQWTQFGHVLYNDQENHLDEDARVTITATGNIFRTRVSLIDDPSTYADTGAVVISGVPSSGEVGLAMEGRTNEDESGYDNFSAGMISFHEDFEDATSGYPDQDWEDISGSTFVTEHSSEWPDKYLVTNSDTGTAVVENLSPRDFVLDIDHINCGMGMSNNLGDGSVLVRAQDYSNAVFLVVQSHHIYWHYRVGGSWGSALGYVAFNDGQNHYNEEVHVRIIGEGDTFTARVSLISNPEIYAQSTVTISGVWKAGSIGVSQYQRKDTDTKSGWDNLTVGMASFVDDFEDTEVDDSDQEWKNIVGTMFVAEDAYSWSDQYLATDDYEGAAVVRGLYLRDFVLEADHINCGMGMSNNLGNGSVLVRAQDYSNAVFLVVQSHHIYWHYRVGGSWGSALGAATFNDGDNHYNEDVHVRIIGEGDTFSARVSLISDPTVFAESTVTFEDVWPTGMVGVSQYYRRNTDVSSGWDNFSARPAVFIDGFEGFSTSSHAPYWLDIEGGTFITEHSGDWDDQYVVTNSWEAASVADDFPVSDFVLDVDHINCGMGMTNELGNGAVLVRAQDYDNAVFLVVQSGHIYWHNRVGGSWGSALGTAEYSDEDDHYNEEVHVRVIGCGDTFNARVWLVDDPSIYAESTVQIQNVWSSGYVGISQYYRRDADTNSGWDNFKVIAAHTEVMSDDIIRYVCPDGTEQWYTTDRGYLHHTMTLVPYTPENSEPTPTQTEINRGYITFSPAGRAGVLPEYRPATAEIVESTSIFASPGEYEQATLAIRPLENLATVSFSIGDFDGPGEATISSSNVDIYIVEPSVEQVGSEQYTDQLHWVGKWLRPGNSEEGFTEKNIQAYFDVHVPAAATPGSYTASVTVSVEGTPTSTFTINLEVLDLVLASSMKWGFFDYGWADPIDNHDTILWELNEMKRNGMTQCVISPVHYGSGPGLGDDGSVNCWVYDEAQKIYQESGLADPPGVAMENLMYGIFEAFGVLGTYTFDANKNPTFAASSVDQNTKDFAGLVLQNLYNHSQGNHGTYDFNSTTVGQQDPHWTSIQGTMSVYEDDPNWADNYLATESTEAAALIKNLVVGDFVFEADHINCGMGMGNGLGNGAVLVRAQDYSNALFLVVQSSQIYWHDRVNGSWGSALQTAEFNDQEDHYNEDMHVTITGDGDTFTARVELISDPNTYAESTVQIQGVWPVGGIGVSQYYRKFSDTASGWDNVVVNVDPWVDSTLWYFADEPNVGSNNMEKAKFMYGIANTYVPDMKTTCTAYSVDDWEELAGLLDMDIVKHDNLCQQAYNQDLVNMAASEGAEMQTLDWLPLKDAFWDTRRHSFQAEKGGADGMMCWTQWIGEKMTASWSPYRFLYNSQKGGPWFMEDQSANVWRSLPWIGIREGIDDSRYVRELIQAAETAEARSYQTEANAAWAVLDDVLDEVHWINDSRNPSTWTAVTAYSERDDLADAAITCWDAIGGE